MSNIFLNVTTIIQWLNMIELRLANKLLFSFV